MSVHVLLFVSSKHVLVYVIKKELYIGKVEQMSRLILQDEGNLRGKTQELLTHTCGQALCLECEGDLEECPCRTNRNLNSWVVMRSHGNTCMFSTRSRASLRAGVSSLRPGAKIFDLKNTNSFPHTHTHSHSH